jgi:hypothetical protein
MLRMQEYDYSAEKMRGHPSIYMWFNAVWAGEAQKVRIRELPRCTLRTLYARVWPPLPERAMGLFSFSQKQVLESARRHIERNQDGRDNHPFDQAVLDWLQDVDLLAPSAVRLPHGWVGMESILLPLIEGNSFEIRCMGCQRNYRPRRLVCVLETHRFGSFHHILDCPEGHRLIAIETVHTV